MGTNKLYLSDNNMTVHMIGIGGISMSGLAEILMNKNVKITGSDCTESEITKRLSEMGAIISLGHSASNISGQDLVVYTAAISQDNPELMEAKRQGIPTIERSELLGAIMDQYENSIAISGTHGKTTTTSMISSIALEAGLDPTIHVGGFLDIIGGNTRVGESQYFIAEACEYKNSFLHFRPSIAIILNIDADHLDFFKDIDDIRKSFEAFISNVRPSGGVVLNIDDPQVRNLSKVLTRPYATFGITSPNADWSCEYTFKDGYANLDVYYKKAFWANIKLPVPGMHNISNALAAIATCHSLGIQKNSIVSGLEKFKNPHRRLEDKGMFYGIRVMDDYAHHPTEIQASLNAARILTTNKLFCVFQPHTYTRTYELLDDFSKSFAQADTVIVTDIYAAREKDTGIINSRMLSDRINMITGNSVYISEFDDIIKYLTENASSGDLIITMGAGNINKLSHQLVKETKISPSP